MRWTFTLFVCAALLAGLGGCGGGGDTSTTSSTSQQNAEVPGPVAQSPESAIDRPGKPGSTAKTETPTPKTDSAGEKPDRSGPNTESPRTKSDGRHQKRQSSHANAKGSAKQSNSSVKGAFKSVRVPRISSAPIAGSKAPAPGVATVEGGDNSVQEYGLEGEEATRREAAIALQGFLNARAEEDWPDACAALARTPVEQLEKYAANASRQGEKLEGCAATLAFLREGPAQMREQAVITEVLSLRGEGEVPGDPSYLIFSGPPGKTLYSMPMYLEGGIWKVGLARAAELQVG